jgi:hypothetical protein
MRDRSRASVAGPCVLGVIIKINGDGGAILRDSGRGRGRREWVIKLVGAGAVRRPVSGERQARRLVPTLAFMRYQLATIPPIEAVFRGGYLTIARYGSV